VKKSQLRNIIKESIKELMTEQSQCSNIQAPSSNVTGGAQSGWYNSSNALVIACNGMLPGWFQNCPNCVTANIAALDLPPSNFQNMIQNGFNNNGCQFLLNWMQNPSHEVTSVPSFGSNQQGWPPKFFYPGENPIWQAKKHKKWHFVNRFYGQNC